MSLLVLASTATAADSLGGFLFAYGEPHAHTGLSHDGWSSDLGDGCEAEGDCGALADVFQTATDNGLDWVVLSDHVNGLGDYSATDAEFLTLMELAIDRAEDTDTVVVPGAEVWFSLAGTALGHKNLMFFGDPEALHDLTLTDVRPTETEDIDVATCSAITDWMADLSARFGDALLVGHHTMVETPMPTDWSCTGGAYEPAVEMFSAWGTGLGWSFDFELPATITASGAVSVAMDPDGFALNLGFLGGTDSHNTLPGDLCQTVGGGRVSTGGLTMAVIPDTDTVSRETLYDAIVDHRTLVTSGPHFPFLPTWSDSRGNTWSLGETIDLPMGQALTLAVETATEGADAVESGWFVYPDGETPLLASSATTWEVSIDEADVPAWMYVAFKLDGAALGLCDDADPEDAEWVWASPSWIVPTDHDWDEDGLSYAAGDVDDDDPAVGACTDTTTIDPATATLGDGDGDGLKDAAEVELGTNPCALDSDGDLLRDDVEVAGITDPTDADSDDDGLDDGAEGVAGTDPNNPDTDRDTLSDGDEGTWGTDPLNPDSDGDTIDDGGEVATGSSPTDADTDDDGLDDKEELHFHTSPTDPDTDRDGVEDAAELELGTDPLAQDTDGDGLRDGEEGDVGTDPLVADSDADGLLDGEELALGTDPRDPDSDDDTLLDGAELDLGTDPRSADTDGDGVDDATDSDPLHPPQVDTGDSGTDDSAVEDTSVGDTGEKTPSRGCGCSAGGTPGLVGLFAVTALLRRRRR